MYDALGRLVAGRDIFPASEGSNSLSGIHTSSYFLM